MIKRSPECLNACLLNLLTEFNVHFYDSDLQITPSYIFNVGGGFALTYKNGDLKTRCFQANFNFLSREGVRYSVLRFKNGNDADCELKSHVKETPYILMVDSSKLSYSTSFRHAQPTPHYILCDDVCNDRLHIIDGFNQDLGEETFSIWIKKKSLLKSMKAWNYEYIILWLNRNMSIPYFDEEKLLEQSLSNYLLGKNKRKSKTGYKAVHAAIQTYAEKGNESRDLYRFCIDVNYELKVDGYLTMLMFLVVYLKHHHLYNSQKRVMEYYDKTRFCLLRILMFGIKDSRTGVDRTLMKLNLCVSGTTRILEDILWERQNDFTRT